MRNLRQLFHVGDVELRIAQRLGVQRLRLRPDGFAQPVEVIGIDELHRDAQLGQRVVKKVVRSAVQRRRRNDVISRRSQRGDDQCLRRLSRRQRQSRHTAFQGRDALLKHVGRRIHDARINVAELLQRKQSRRMVGIVEYVRRRLVNRHSSCLGCRVLLLPAVNGECVEVILRLLVGVAHRLLLCLNLARKTQRPTACWLWVAWKLCGSYSSLCRFNAQPTDRHPCTCTWPWCNKGSRCEWRST